MNPGFNKQPENYVEENYEIIMTIMMKMTTPSTDESESGVGLYWLVLTLISWAMMMLLLIMMTTMMIMMKMLKIVLIMFIKIMNILMMIIFNMTLSRQK